MMIQAGNSNTPNDEKAYISRLFANFLCITYRVILDYILGNPPYQEDVQNKGDRANPIYDKFMQATYEVGDVVELIHPARFLFNAGQTSKTWNEKMLNDEHFKVLKYYPDASQVFPNTDIKGGVVISIHDNRKDYGAIGVFTAFEELNSIIHKVISQADVFIDSIVSSRGMYRFSDAFFADYPHARNMVGSGTGNMIVSNIFERMSEAFTDNPADGAEQICILGRINNQRKRKYIDAKYVIDNEYISTYNAMLAEANGTGTFGEVLSSPFTLKPGEGATDTFISIGHYTTQAEADNTIKYIKSKFGRAMLGASKATQHNPKSVWKYLPLQDFTPASDIDWSASIPEIDQQLYRKYGLDGREIDFIETHVKEMN